MDDTIATYSSRGPTRGFTTDANGVRRYDNFVKPDLVAPGNKLVEAESDNNYLVTQTPSLDAGVSGADNRKMMYLSGTSMATPVAAGTRLPGIARQQLGVALDWRDGDWNAGIEGIGMGDVAVNDQGSERAPGYFVVDAHAGRRWRFGRSELLAFVRVDNLLDKRYIGSVIVNDGNGRYYEPAPGRGFLVGARWQWGGD